MRLIILAIMVLAGIAGLPGLTAYAAPSDEMSPKAAGVVLGQAAGDGAGADVEGGPVEEVTVGRAFLLKLRQGGLTMLFLLLASIIGVAYGIERIANLRRSNIAPAGLADQANRLWTAKDFTKLEREASQSNSTLGRVIASLVKHRDSNMNDLSIIAGDIASRDLKRHLQRAYPLAVIATIAPLLGLFGTIVGLIGAFDQIALMGELANPAAFGGDIAKALITTAGGLAVAIPALAAYHYFRSRVSLLGTELEEQASELIAEWFVGGDAGKPAPDTSARPVPAPLPSAAARPAPPADAGKTATPKKETTDAG